MQYLMDTRLEALYGFAVSRDDRLARKALRDFYNVQLPNGLLPCHSPANILQIIPTFTFYWIMMLHDHYRYFGDKRLIEGCYPGVEKALAYFTDRLNGQRLLTETGFWQFVDWTADWERGVPAKNADEVNVIHTLMLVFALRQGAELAEVIGRSDCAGQYWQLAEEICGAVNHYAYDEVRGLYTDTVGRPQWSQHAQVWKVLSGVAEGERARTILQAAMEKPDAAKCSFCMQYFLFRVLEKVGLYALTRKQWLLWKQMLEMRVTTWPEDPVNWRSDCHAWSAVPLQELMSRSRLWSSHIIKAAGKSTVYLFHIVISKSSDVLHQPNFIYCSDLFQKNEGYFFQSVSADFYMSLQIVFYLAGHSRYNCGCTVFICFIIECVYSALMTF